MFVQRELQIARGPTAMMKLKNRLLSTIEPANSAKALTTTGTSDLVGRKDSSREAGGVEGTDHFETKWIGRAWDTEKTFTNRAMRAGVSNSERRHIVGFSTRKIFVKPEIP